MQPQDLGGSTPPADTCLSDGEYGVFEGAAEDRVVFGSYRRDGRWSTELVQLLPDLLGGAGTLIDVGANIGLLCIPVLERSTGTRGVAIEPAPGNFALLERNVRRHGLQQRVECLACAASDETAPLWLSLSPHNHGDHRLSARPAPGACAVRVQGAPLHSLLAGRSLEAPVVMKVDTQGAERRVLAGAGALLSRVDHLIVEYWPAGLRRAGDSVEALHGLLAQFPYGVVLGLGRSTETLTPVAELLEALSWIASHDGDEGFFDLLLSRQRKLDVAARVRR